MASRISGLWGLGRHQHRRGRPARLLRAGTVFAVSAAVAAAGAGVSDASAPRHLAPAHGAPAHGEHAAPAGTISTVAGGVGGPGPATQVAFGPCGVSYAGGHLDVGANMDVRQISTATDRLTTPLGTGLDYPFDFHDGESAVKASLAGACVTATDAAGDLATTGENGLLFVPATSGTFFGEATAAHHLYRVAGGGKDGSAANGIPAASAKIVSIRGLAMDAAGNLIFTSVNRVRVVADTTGTYYGQAMTAGYIYTIAGGLGYGDSGDGGPATKAKLDDAWGMAVDPAGNVVICDYDNQQLRVVAATSGTFYGQAMTADDIYTAATVGFPTDVAVGASGNLVVDSSAAGRIVVVAETAGTFYGAAMTAGGTYTIASTGSGESEPVGVDGAGNAVLAVGDDGFGGGMVQVVAADAGTFYGQAMTAGGTYTIAGNGESPNSAGNDAGEPPQPPYGYDDAGDYFGNGGPVSATQLDTVNLAADASGNLLLTENNQVQAVAESTSTFYGKAMTTGHIYTVAGDGTAGYSGDGGPAVKAELDNPSGVTVDSAGNLVIADSFNSRIRVVAASTGSFYGKAMTAGHIYTVAGKGKAGFSGDGGPATKAKLDDPATVAVDPAGNLVIADGSLRVRLVAVSTGTFYGVPMTAGDIYTIAGDGKESDAGDGGPATSAGLSPVSDVAVDSHGNVLIAQPGYKRIRMVAESTGTFYGIAVTAGDIYTVAGGGEEPEAGGQPATDIEFNLPTDVAVDPAGNLVISDYYDSHVWAVAGSTGTFYGKDMLAGCAYPIIGTGTAGYTGNGGPATGARIYYPSGLAIDSQGDIYFADTGNYRIRKVTA